MQADIFGIKFGSDESSDKKEHILTLDDILWKCGLPTDKEVKFAQYDYKNKKFKIVFA